jgi:hypothetical protein
MPTTQALEIIKTRKRTPHLKQSLQVNPLYLLSVNRQKQAGAFFVVGYLIALHNWRRPEYALLPLTNLPLDGPETAKDGLSKGFSPFDKPHPAA